MLGIIQNYFYICNPQGEMLEWLKRRVWKARDRPKRFRSSNLLLSATIKRRSVVKADLLCFYGDANQALWMM